MGYPSYDSYDSTLAPWLNKKPSAWEERKLKFCVDLINEKITAKNSDLAFMGLEHIESWTGKRVSDPNSQSEGVATKFKPNDVLFGKLRPYLAKVYKAEHEGLATTEALILRCNNDIEPDFLKYYLLSSEFIDVVDGSTYGSKMPRANYEFIGNLSILVPNNDKQTQIAKFLDYKTAQIDRLIEKKKALIEKLSEQRIAMITQAVTKGLNPDAPMKDSEVDWLGEVPEHWIVSKLKYVTNQIIDGAHFTPTYVSEGVPFLRVTDIVKSGGKAIDLNGVKLIPIQEHADLIKRCKPEKGDILYSKNGTIGIPRVIDWDWDFSIFVSLSLLKTEKDKINSHYLAYYLTSKVTQNQIEIGAKSNTVTNLHLDKIKEFIITLPSLDEQGEIVEKLDFDIKKINNMLDVNNQTIEKLNEYRTALITAAVTGKIDVREVNVPEGF